MNWAMPCAPFGLTASGLKRLSCQMRRVKKSRGSPLSLAATLTTRQISLAETLARLAPSADFAVSGPATFCGSARAGRWFDNGKINTRYKLIRCSVILEDIIAHTYQASA